MSGTRRSTLRRSMSRSEPVGQFRLPDTSPSPSADPQSKDADSLGHQRLEEREKLRNSLQGTTAALANMKNMAHERRKRLSMSGPDFVVPSTSLSDTPIDAETANSQADATKKRSMSLSMIAKTKILLGQARLNPAKSLSALPTHLASIEEVSSNAGFATGNDVKLSSRDEATNLLSSTDLDLNRGTLHSSQRPPTISRGSSSASLASINNGKNDSLGELRNSSFSSDAAQLPKQFASSDPTLPEKPTLSRRLSNGRPFTQSIQAEGNQISSSQVEENRNNLSQLTQRSIWLDERERSLMAQVSSREENLRSEEHRLLDLQTLLKEDRAEVKTQKQRLDLIETRLSEEKLHYGQRVEQLAEKERDCQRQLGNAQARTGALVEFETKLKSDRDELDKQKESVQSKFMELGNQRQALETRKSDLIQSEANLSEMKSHLMRREESLAADRQAVQADKLDNERKSNFIETESQRLSAFASDLDARKKIIDVESTASAKRTSEFNALRKGITERESDLNAIARRLELSERDLVERVAQCEERDSVLKSERIYLEQERLRLQADTKSFMSDKGRIQTELKAALDAKSHVQALSAEMDGQLEALQRRETSLNDKESEVETLLLRLKSREADIASLGKRVEIERLECEKRRCTIMNREEELNERERATLDKERAIAQIEQQTLQNKIRGEQQLGQLMDDHNAREQSLSARESDLLLRETAHSAKLDGFEQERNKHNLEIGEQQKNIHQSESSLETLVRRLDEERRMFDQARQTIEEDLDRERVALENEKQEFTESLEQFQTERDNNNRKLRDSQSRLGEMSKQLEAKSQEIARKEQLIESQMDQLTLRLSKVRLMEQQRTDLSIMVEQVKERKSRLESLERGLLSERLDLKGKLELADTELKAISVRQVDCSDREQQLVLRSSQLDQQAALLESKENELHSEVRKMEEDRDKIRAMEQSVESRRKACRQNEKDIKRKVEDIQVERQIISDERDRQVQQFAEVQAKIDALKQEITSERAILLQQKELQSEQHSLWERELSAKLQQVDEREQSRLEDFRRNQLDLEASLKSNHEFELELQVREKSLLERESMISDQARKGVQHLEQRSQQLDELEKSIRQADSENRAHKEKLRERLVELESSQKRLGARSEELSIQEDKIAQQRALVDQMRSEIEQKSNRMDQQQIRFQSDCQAHQALMGSRLEDLRQQKSDLDHDRRTLDEKSAIDVARLRAESERLSEGKRMLENEQGILERMKLKAFEQRKLDELREKELKNKQDKCAEWETRLSRQERELEKRVVELHATMGHSKLTLETSRKELSQVESKRKNMERMCEQLSLKHETIDSKVREAFRQINNAKSQLSAIENEKQTASKSLQAIKEESERTSALLKEDSIDFEIRRSKWAAGLAEQKSTLQRLERYLRIKERELETKQKELDDREISINELEIRTRQEEERDYLSLQKKMADLQRQFDDRDANRQEQLRIGQSSLETERTLLHREGQRKAAELQRLVDELKIKKRAIQKRSEQTALVSSIDDELRIFASRQSEMEKYMAALSTRDQTLSREEVLPSRASSPLQSEGHLLLPRNPAAAVQTKTSSPGASHARVAQIPSSSEHSPVRVEHYVTGSDPSPVRATQPRRLELIQHRLSYLTGQTVDDQMMNSLMSDIPKGILTLGLWTRQSSILSQLDRLDHQIFHDDDVEPARRLRQQFAEICRSTSDLIEDASSEHVDSGENLIERAAAQLAMQKGWIDQLQFLIDQVSHRQEERLQVVSVHDALLASDDEDFQEFRRRVRSDPSFHLRSPATSDANSRGNIPRNSAQTSSFLSNQYLAPGPDADKLWPLSSNDEVDSSKLSFGRNDQFLDHR